MKYYAVIDTNVLVSALQARHSDSATVTIIRKVFSGEVVPVFCKEIFNEYFSVLQRKKFGFDTIVVATFLHALQHLGVFLEARQIGISLPDVKDMPFYAVTLTHGEAETYLVTGNLKHFPASSFVVSPAHFLEIIELQEQDM